MWCIVVPTNSGGRDIDIPDVYGPFNTAEEARLIRDNTPRLRYGQVVKMRGQA